MKVQFSPNSEFFDRDPNSVAHALREMKFRFLIGGMQTAEGSLVTLIARDEVEGQPFTHRRLFRDTAFGPGGVEAAPCGHTFPIIIRTNGKTCVQVNRIRVKTTTTAKSKAARDDGTSVYRGAGDIGMRLSIHRRLKGYISIEDNIVVFYMEYAP